MIWDVVQFAGEMDMLQCRVAELEQVPDLWHIVVQSTHTFRGERRRFQEVDWLPRVQSLVYRPRFDFPESAWNREIAQRNLADRYEAIAEEDIVLICDVDEIPRASVVESLPSLLTQLQKPVALPMRMHYWGPQWVAPGLWYQPKAAFRRDIPRAGSHVLRMADSPPGIVPRSFGSAGWHLSYFGGPERCSAKLQAFSHEELDTPETHAKLAQWAAEGSNMHDELLERYEGTDWPRGFSW